MAEITGIADDQVLGKDALGYKSTGSFFWDESDKRSK